MKLIKESILSENERKRLKENNYHGAFYGNQGPIKIYKKDTLVKDTTKLPNNWVIAKYNSRYALMKNSEYEEASKNPSKWFSSWMIDLFPTKKALIQAYKNEPFYKHIFKDIEIDESLEESVELPSNTVRLKDGKVEHIFSFEDVCNLIREYSGDDLAHIVENTISEKEEEIKQWIETLIDKYDEFIVPLKDDPEWKESKDVIEDEIKFINDVKTQYDKEYFGESLKESKEDYEKSNYVDLPPKDNEHYVIDNIGYQGDSIEGKYRSGNTFFAKGTIYGHDGDNEYEDDFKFSYNPETKELKIRDISPVFSDEEKKSVIEILRDNLETNLGNKGE